MRSVEQSSKLELRNQSGRKGNRKTEVRVARGFDDLLMVYAVRSAVYIAEQDCPFAEEFDGNDHCATHFIGFVEGEPAGCLRARFFHDFVKLERLAIRKSFRRSSLAFELVREGIGMARRKGFRRVYGHAREGLEPFWARFGGKLVEDSEPFVFSDHAYREMVLEIEPSFDAIDLSSDPMVILRPEGDWDRPGVLEQSNVRPARRLHENVVEKRQAGR
jgi:predicted GNAT family N-acyltransferase